MVNLLLIIIFRRPGTGRVSACGWVRAGAGCSRPGPATTPPSPSSSRASSVSCNHPGVKYFWYILNIFHLNQNVVSFDEIRVEVVDYERKDAVLGWCGVTTHFSMNENRLGLFTPNIVAGACVCPDGPARHGVQSAALDTEGHQHCGHRHSPHVGIAKVLLSFNKTQSHVLQLIINIYRI